MLYDPQHENRDHVVKTCYIMMISAISEAQRGIEKLWSRGRSNVRTYYGNFGRCVDKNYFKAFVSADHYCVGNKKWWCLDKRDELWDTLIPFLKKCDRKRKILMTLLFLALDESMS